MKNSLVAIRIIMLASVISFSVDGYRILGVYNFPSRSHFQLGHTLLKELAARGHEVTMISPYPQEVAIENYTHIALPEMVEFVKKNMDYDNERTEFQMWHLLKMYFKVSQGVSITLRSKGVTDLLKSNAKFDLVIIEYFLTEALLGIAHRFQTPVILVSSTDATAFLNAITQNPMPYSYVPNLFLQSTDRMSFPERVQNAVFSFANDLVATYYQPVYQNLIMRDVFPDAPHVTELMKNVSLVLVNAHHSISYPKPLVPNVIQIGGFHIQEPKTVSPDLKTFLDEGSEGVIYFSLGTNVHVKKMAKEKLFSIMNAFKHLQNRVLIKMDNKDEIELPDNVKISSWLPQNDILAHPNVKVFITHGGMLSIMEAVYHGVPIIGIPYFGDQNANVRRSVIDGYGIELNYEEINEENLIRAINELLSNPRYRNTIQRKSKIFKDQPLKPLDTAIYWVEYVLKHRDTRHLQTRAVYLSWYQLLLLDVLAYIVAATLLVIFLVHKLFVRWSINKCK